MKSKKEELEAELTRLNALRKQVKEKLKALPLLEIGKWYLIDCEGYYSPTARNAIVYDNGEDYSYGFNFEGEFVNEFNLSNCRKDIIREATPQEVEKSLIEEAKRRYKIGDKVTQLDKFNVGNYPYTENGYNFKIRDINEPLLHIDGDGTYFYLGNLLVFQDGKWATIIEQDKFAELKEAHRNWAVIEFRSKYTNFEWKVTLDPALGDFSEYRIKTEEKPKVGDACKFWCENDHTFTIGILEEIDEEGYFWCNDYCYNNAKPLTKQEAIDLLFNKGAN